MANMSNFLEERLLNYLFRGTAYTPPATLYVALLTDTIDDSVVSGGDLPEVAGLGYGRRGIAREANAWSAPNADGIVKNTQEIKWEEVDWEATIVAVAFCDSEAPGSGNVLFWGDLVREKVVAEEDTVSFAPNSIIVQIDNDRA